MPRLVGSVAEAGPTNEDDPPTVWILESDAVFLPVRVLGLDDPVSSALEPCRYGLDGAGLGQVQDQQIVFAGCFAWAAALMTSELEVVADARQVRGRVNGRDRDARC